MPSTRRKETKTGTPFYEITVSRGRGNAPLTTRWYPPEGWSQRAIDRELTKVAAEFERKCHSGEIMSRKEQKLKKAEEAMQAAQVLTLRQFGQQVFMASKAVTIAENTRDSFQRCLDKWVYPLLGNTKMPDITSAQLSALLLSLQSEGKKHSSVVKLHAILHSLFKQAYMTETIERNPMDKVERPRPRKDECKNQEIEAYTADELRRILYCLESEPLKWQTYIRLLIDTGIRRGEACGLQWKYVDFQKHKITIAANLCYTGSKGTYLDTPKNGKSRTIDVDPAVIELLRQLRQEQSFHAISPFVFSQDNSPAPMHPQSPSRFFQKFSKRHSIPDFHPHKLRHSFASVAITNGADIASISEMLGHSDKAVTLRMYTHADEESMKRASNIFRTAIKNA